MIASGLATDPVRLNMHTLHLNGTVTVGTIVTGVIVLVGAIVEAVALGAMVKGIVGAIVVAVVGAVVEGTAAAVGAIVAGPAPVGATVVVGVLVVGAEVDGVMVGKRVVGLSVGALVLNRASNSSMVASKLPHEDLPSGGLINTVISFSNPCLSIQNWMEWSRLLPNVAPVKIGLMNTSSLIVAIFPLTRSSTRRIRLQLPCCHSEMVFPPYVCRSPLGIYVNPAFLSSST